MAKGEPQSEKLVQDYVSRFYQERYSGSGLFYHTRIVNAMLDCSPNSKILDVGCGIGFVSGVRPDLDIVGIDISDGMLERNPHKWVKASAEKIPFEDGYFDVVLCRSLLHHLEDPAVGMKEMVRVLKPGGKFVCWDPNQSVLNTAFRKLFQRTERFSHLHKSFCDKELFKIIDDSGIKITDKRYIGFLAYPLCAFPDIVNFGLPLWATKFLIRLDELIAKTPFKTWSWSLLVKGEK